MLEEFVSLPINPRALGLRIAATALQIRFDLTIDNSYSHTKVQLFIIL
jgi:hypothetical protein